MTDSSNENWKPIPGFEGLYSVSDLGRIRSEARVVSRIGRGTLTIPEKIMKTPPTKGYPRFNANKDGRPSQLFVHQIVMLTFVGPPGARQEIRHKNGDRSDARLCNLEYGTRAENIADAKRHGTFPLHESRPGAKLNRMTARKIAESKETAESLASRYGVARAVIQQIRRGETWSAFTEDVLKTDYYFRGEDAKHSKITSADALTISKSDAPQRLLADIYGVSPRAIWAIRNGYSWQHVTGIKRRGRNPPE